MEILTLLARSVTKLRCRGEPVLSENMEYNILLRYVTNLYKKITKSYLGQIQQNDI